MLMKKNVQVVDLPVIIYDNECGSAGYKTMDFNKDCIVNLEDFATFAGEWLACSYPNDPACE